MLSLTLTLVQLLAPTPSGPRVDAYGDPLPPGALARFGTVRWRCPDPPDHLIWSPDGKYLIGTYGGKGLTIWAYPTGVVVERFEVPKPFPEPAAKGDSPPFAPALTPQNVRFAPDSRSMLVYAGQNQLFQVTLPDGCYQQLDTGGHRGTAVAASVDGRRLLLEVPYARKEGDRWSELCVLDLTRPGRIHPLWNRPVVVRDMDLVRLRVWDRARAAGDAQMTRDGRFVVAPSGAEHDALIDLGRGRSWMLPGGTLRQVCMSPDGRWFLATDSQGRLNRWLFADARSGLSAPLAKLVVRTPEEHPGQWQVCPDGRKAVSVGRREVGRDGHARRTVTVLDAATLRPVGEWAYRPGDEVPVWNGAAGAPAGAVSGEAGQAFAVAPDNHTLAVASADSPRLRFFDMTSGAELRPVGGHAAAVSAVRVVGRKLITVASDGGGRLWEPVGPGARSRREAEVFDELGEDDLPTAESRTRIKAVYDWDQNVIEVRDRETEVVGWEQNVSASITAPRADRPRSLPTATVSDWHGGRVAFAIGELVSVRDHPTGEALVELRLSGLRPTAVEFGPDPDTLVVGYHDGQILMWDLRPPDLPRRPPTAAELAGLWADLAGSPRAAARARAVFREHPDAALDWLRAHLQPLARPTDYDIDLWLARLAHPRFQVREDATRHLVRHFDVAGPAVREVLAVTRAPEVEHRLRAILDSHARSGGDGDVVRLVRVVAILERIGTPDAKELLVRVARGGGVPAARAADALVRVRERGKGRPANEVKSVIAQARPAAGGR